MSCAVVQFSGRGGFFFCAVLLCGFVPLLAQCVLPAGEGWLVGSVIFCSSVLLPMSVLVLVPVVGPAGFCAGVVCVWQLCSGKMLFLGMSLELL